MNNKNNNYRVMKFFEPVNKKDKAKGYVRLDIRGIRGNIIVSLENVGDVKTTSEVYLYKDRLNKIKIGDINNKRGMIKKILTFGENSTLEDYNICGIVKDKKIVLYACLFNPVHSKEISKLDTDFDIKDLSEEPEAVETKKDNEEYLNETTDEKVNEKQEATESVFDELQIDESQIDDSEPEEVEKDDLETEESDESANENLSDEIDNQKESEAEIKAAAEALGRKNNYQNKFEENLYTILSNYKKLEPLSVRIKDLTWWELPFDDRGVKNGNLPYYNQIVSSYYPYPVSNRVTTCNSLMKKYGHYIFGIFRQNGNITRFVYGIPGEFKREEQPYKGITGFKNWSYKNKNKEGDYGYWLAFVDAVTGEVTEPPQIALR